MHRTEFFVLRTPLLPFDLVTGLSDGLEAAGAVDDATHLTEAWHRDRARIRERLRALVQMPAIREAIFVASPDLDAAIDRWMQTPNGRRADATERALIRYVTRMAARATPFGLFAGSGVGQIAPTTTLVVSEQAECRRHTRLDMDYLVLLADALGRDPTLAAGIRYTPNSSLYRSADGWRYVETRLQDKTRSHHLVALEDDEAIAATLDRAREGATRASLAAALVDEDVSGEEADAFVGDLIESQVLTPDLECPVTGPEPLAHLEATARRHAAGGGVADRLAGIASELEAIDAEGVGVSPARYREIVTQLEAFTATVDLTRLFQVDLVRPAAAATLGPDVLDEILQGVDILRRLSPTLDQELLGRFRAAFAERYEERAVPLIEALDEESGVGSALVEGSNRDASPLLRGLAFPAAPETTAPWGRRETGLLGLVGKALLAGCHELTLTPRDVEELGNPDPPQLPEMFSAMATLIARSTGGPMDRDYRILVHATRGPSGAACLGRFCHGDRELLAQVSQHLREEEACDPDALFAEVVHLPEGRLGNILSRPVLREYEIPYLGRSGAPPDRQIPVSDLTVALVDGRFVLRSHRHERRIVPRLTSAHNFTTGSLNVYRFLCLLQSEGRLAPCAWRWGPLAGLPFLPRVTYGRLVFSRAMWRVTTDEVRTLKGVTGPARYAAVQSWRSSRRLPRWVVLTDHDNTLPIDLDNVVGVESLVHLFNEREPATLTEMYPGPGELCAIGGDGRYVHELLIPCHGSPEPAKPVAPRMDINAPRERSDHAPSIQRTFAPGSEWIYAKLYAGPGSADRLLTEVVAPVSRALLADRTIDRWFFVRYADPDEHLRWRLRAAPGARATTVRRRIETAAASLMSEGRVRRLVFDTYELEIERYGGPPGIDAAEQYFWADSEAVVDVLGQLSAGDATAELRWRMAIPGVDSLLADFRLDLDARLQIMRRLRERFGREFRADAAFARQLAAKFRPVRKELEHLLTPGAAPDPTRPWIDGFTRRSALARAALDALHASARCGFVTTSIDRLAESYVHMHLNRLFRAEQRAHELVIYDFMLCLYEARLARSVSAT